MKIFSNVLLVVYVFSCFVGLTFAATTPSLGEASRYAILASTYTNTIAGIINGDVGYTTPPSVFPIINGEIVTPKSTQAGLDQNLALVALNNQPCDFSFIVATDLSLLPQPLNPGVYCFVGATSIGAGGITLDGAGTYIFRIDAALNTTANSIVTLSGGASSCDIFWTPTATTLGADSIFKGTVIDNTAITVGNNVNREGRALNFATTITTNNDTITVPICINDTIVVMPTILVESIVTGENVVIISENIVITGENVVITGENVVITGENVVDEDNYVPFVEIVETPIVPIINMPIVPKLPKTGLDEDVVSHNFIVGGSILVIFLVIFVVIFKRHNL